MMKKQLTLRLLLAVTGIGLFSMGAAFPAAPLQSITITASPSLSPAEIERINDLRVVIVQTHEKWSQVGKRYW